MIKGSGSVPRTNGSGFGRSKNIRILRIRIRIPNTGRKFVTYMSVWSSQEWTSASSLDNLRFNICRVKGMWGKAACLAVWPTGGTADRLAGGHVPGRGSGRQPQAGQPSDVLQVSPGNLKWSSFSTTIYGPMIHPTPLNAFDAGKSFTRGKWEGVGPWKSRLFWALWKASSCQASAIWGSKVEISRAQPPSHLPK